MNIYVGNLPYTTTESDLRKLFETYGKVVTAKIITDKLTPNNRSKGFGFVEMGDAEGAAAAIAGLNGTSLNGRQLKISQARNHKEGGRPERSERSDRSDRGSRY